MDTDLNLEVVEKVGNFIKVMIILPEEHYMQILSESCNHYDRFHYERSKIAEFRDDIFNENKQGIFKFNNEHDYSQFIRENDIEGNPTNEWYKVLFFAVGNNSYFYSSEFLFAYMQRKGDNFIHSQKIKDEITFCKQIVARDNDFKLSSDGYNPNSVEYNDWRIIICGFDKRNIFTQLEYIPRRMRCTHNFHESYKVFLNEGTEYLAKYNNEDKSVLAIVNNAESLVKLKRAIDIDISDVKLGDKLYWKVRSKDFF